MAKKKDNTLLWLGGAAVLLLFTMANKNDNIGFVKLDYSEDDLERKKREVEKYFRNNLPKNYKLVSVTGSIANGLSIYATVMRDDTPEEIVFRISDHANGFGHRAVSVTSFGVQIQGYNIDAMLVYFGDADKNIVRLKELNTLIDLLRSKGYTDKNIAIKDALKEIKKITPLM